MGALIHNWASLVTQLVKNPLATWETWVRSMGWDNPLEKGKTTHSIIFAWIVLWTEEPGRLPPMGSQSQIQLRDWHTDTHNTNSTQIIEVVLITKYF